MKKHLLTMLLAVVSAAAMAQSSVETALDLVAGTNTSAEASAYYKYTPAQNEVISFDLPEGDWSASVTAYDEDGTTVLENGAMLAYPDYAYPAYEGKTMYFYVTTSSATLSFDAKIEACPNLGKGQTADDPMPIEEGVPMYMQPVTQVGNYLVNFGQYVAEEDGMLVLSCASYLTVTVNGTSISNVYVESIGGYQWSVAVTAGETYDVQFSGYNPVVVYAELTHPEKGSFEMPFEITEGENTVPAGFGEYWYTYSNGENTGFGVISSDNKLPGGQVSVYSDKSYAMYGSYATAQSQTGSYDTRFEMAYGGYTYYIKVQKVEPTDADDTFTFAFEGYQPGDKENNPIVINEMPGTNTLKSGSGTNYYYSLTVEPNDTFKLNIEPATSFNENTTVAVYKQYNSWNAVAQSLPLTTVVSGGNGAEQVYIIRFTSYESSPVQFYVTRAAVKQGDLITDPLPAVIGDNVIQSAGDKYYSYTATIDGKLVVTKTDDMTVTFPRGTYEYAGNYSTVVDGNVSYIEVTKDTEYLIAITGAAVKDVFTLAEEEFEVGESRTNPMIVENGTFTLDETVYGNHWLQYTVERDGVLEITCDVPYSYMNSISYCKSTDESTSSMVSYSGYNAVYSISTLVSAGDVYLVNLQLSQAYEGKAVTFSVRDLQAGESVDNPIMLVNGETVVIPSPSRNLPIWCSVPLVAGDVRIEASDYVSGYWYKDIESAKADNGEVINMQYEYDENWMLVCYYYATTVTEPSTYYMKLDSGYGETELKLIGEQPTSIDGVSVADGSVVVGDGAISVNAANANVQIYGISGTKVAQGNVAGSASFSLTPGVYIVKINDTVNKVIVR